MFEAEFRLSQINVLKDESVLMECTIVNRGRLPPSCRSDESRIL
jgi:hypothetical protein